MVEHDGHERPQCKELTQEGKAVHCAGRAERAVLFAHPAADGALLRPLSDPKGSTRAIF